MIPEIGHFALSLALIVAGLRGGGWDIEPDDLISADIEGGPIMAARKAAELYELFIAHVKARIGTGLVTQEEKTYRKLLEFEEFDSFLAHTATIRSTSKLARIALWVVIALMTLQSLGVSIQGLLAFGGIFAVMALRRRDKLDPTVSVFVVVPVHKRGCPFSCLIKTFKAFAWKVRAIFAGSKQGFRIRIIVTDSWATVGSRYA